MLKVVLECVGQDAAVFTYNQRPISKIALASASEQFIKKSLKRFKLLDKKTIQRDVHFINGIFKVNL